MNTQRLGWFGILILLVLTVNGWCQPSTTKTTVIFDTDTNNELDDQHALAYLLFNGSRFTLSGVTVNATRGGGNIDEQYAEAVRVMKLCGFEKDLPIYKGANGSYPEILPSLGNPSYDGEDAVNFILSESRKINHLVVIAVGKLTNVALALKQDPSLAGRIRLVWLGSNFPEPGEYNLNNDTASVNAVIRSGVPLEIVTVRYGRQNGSDVVRVTKTDVERHLAGKGPTISTPVSGRHGGTFVRFGDYSMNLFDHVQYNGNPPSRALFDMVAVAVVKDPAWGVKKDIPAPALKDGKWVEQPGNPRKISLWEDFDKKKILEDFYRTMDRYQIIQLAD